MREQQPQAAYWMRENPVRWQKKAVRRGNIPSQLW